MTNGKESQTPDDRYVEGQGNHYNIQNRDQGLSSLPVHGLPSFSSDDGGSSASVSSESSAESSDVKKSALDGAPKESEDDDDSHDEDENDRVGPMVSECEGNQSSRLLEMDNPGPNQSLRHRGQLARLRSSNSMNPRSTPRRHPKSLLKPIRDMFSGNEDESAAQDESSQPMSVHGRLMVQQRDVSGDIESGLQYRLEAVPKQPRMSHRLRQCLGLGEGANSIYSATVTCFGFNLNDAIMKYLRWTFRSTFRAVLLTFLLGFFGFTMFFALLIWIAGHRHPKCIGGVDFESEYFTDAFALSWTTFSTVGYGVVYSGISTDNPEIRECTGVTILVTLEAFVGMLFSSFCSAIVFTKINRIQSFAQVSFSDPMVIRYGSGVQVEYQQDEGSTDFTKSQQKIPCPILEFRIVNRMDRIQGGEILDANLSVVASISASQARHLDPVETYRRRRRKGKKKRNSVNEQTFLRQKTGSTSTVSGNEASNDGVAAVSDEENPSQRSDLTHRHSQRAISGNAPILLTSSKSMKESIRVDPTGHLAHTKIFSKLEVESPDHPFFKRVWTVRHTLNHHSPLLVESTRRQVERNGGHWPSDLNSATAVRSSIKFDRILVGLSGTSNADTNSVYAKKIYAFDDINVGYRFVNLLYRNSDGELCADIRLINDVVEQAGGGGEIIDSVFSQPGGSIDNMLVL